MKKKKLTRDTIPEGFTLTSALENSLVVICFSLAIFIFSYRTSYYSYPIVIGGLMTIISGFIKVLWKIIVVLKKKNVWWMFVQMRIILPVGFSIYIFGLIQGYQNYSSYIANASFYNKFCFLIFIFGMCLLFIYAAAFDLSNPKFNWIEQLTNTICLCFAAWL